MNRRHPLLLLLILFIAACGSNSADSPSTIAPTETQPEIDGPTATVAPTATSGITPSPTPIALNDGELLPLDDFFSYATDTIMQRDPEWTTQLGYEAAFSAEYKSLLTNESPAYASETYAIVNRLLAELGHYDRAEMTPGQRISADILAYWLEDVAAHEAFHFYAYPFNTITGEQWYLYRSMLSGHPLNNLEDAEGFVAKVWAFEEKFVQLKESLDESRAQGIYPPAWMTLQIAGQMDWLAGGLFTDFQSYFESTVGDLPDVSDEDFSRLTGSLRAARTESAAPAYADMADYLREMADENPGENGAWHHPNGDAYYAVALRHHTTTDLSADEIHQIGLVEVARLQAEIRTFFSDLDYPEDVSITTGIQLVSSQGGDLPASTPAEINDVLDEYDRIIEEAKTAFSPYFDILPQADLEIDYQTNGAAYYIGPALDGSRPGTFFTTISDTYHPRFDMQTLSYHEGIPGHHYQIALQSEIVGLPAFRNIFSFTAYAEGWALYAEQLATEIGLYDEYVYGDIGRIQMELFRAARLVVDTGIHAKQWTYLEAVDYMVETTGLSRPFMESEVSRYISWPGQATAYKIGQLKILELREMAQSELGDQFDYRAFHNVILQNGSMPLSVLETVVVEWINSQ